MVLVVGAGGAPPPPYWASAKGRDNKRRAVEGSILKLDNGFVIEMAVRKKKVIHYFIENVLLWNDVISCNVMEGRCRHKGRESA